MPRSANAQHQSSSAVLHIALKLVETLTSTCKHDVLSSTFSRRSALFSPLLLISLAPCVKDSRFSTVAL